jgi:hypothetical protein
MPPDISSSGGYRLYWRTFVFNIDVTLNELRGTMLQNTELFALMAIECELLNQLDFSELITELPLFCKNVFVQILIIFAFVITADLFLKYLKLASLVWHN